MADQFEQLLLKVKLQGGPQTNRELNETAAAVTKVGVAAEVTGKKTAFAAEKAFIFGEEMYSLRRYAFFAQTALALTGVEVLKMGYDFDEARSKGVDALSALVGGTARARTEVAGLVSLTHTSGLGLEVLTGAAQRMLNFGFSVATTNRYLSAFANYSGKLGLGAGGVTSLSNLFNTIQGQGFVNERQLRSFSNITGLSGNRVATQGLGLSRADAYSLIHGQLQIGASTALPLLASYLQRYAARQPSSLGQQWAIARSYISQIVGTAGAPAFGWLAHTAGNLTAPGGLLARITAGGQPGGGGMLRALDPSGTLTNAWRTLAGAIRIVWANLQALWAVVRPVIGGLLLLSSAILSITSHSTALKLILEPLIALYITHRAILLSNVVALRAAAAATVLYEFWVLRAEYAQLALNFAMDANPIGLIIIGVAGLAAGLYLLYTRVTWFRNAIDYLWHNIINGSPAVSLAFSAAFGPVFLALDATYQIIKNWHTITGFGHGILSFIEHPFGSSSPGAGIAYRPIRPAKDTEIHLHLALDGQPFAHAMVKHKDLLAGGVFHAKATAQARA